MLTELDIIDRYLRPLATDSSAFSLTDDAGLIATEAMNSSTREVASRLIVSTDTLVEDVHFFSDDSATEVARKALRVSLSDLAAKGATPRGYLLNLALPRSITENYIRNFCKGLADDQCEFQITLVGGDTVSTHGPVIITITAWGEAGSRGLISRSGGQAGDLVFVSGPLGDAAIGLELQLISRGSSTDPVPGGICPETRKQLKSYTSVARAYFEGRRLLPMPRTDQLNLIAEKASASMDISDGLMLDLERICRASSCEIELDVSRIPVSPTAGEAIANQSLIREFALSGGDDYEILACTSPINRSAFEQAGWTEIGVLNSGRSFDHPTAVVTLKGRENPKHLPIKKGYIHSFGSQPQTVSHACDRLGEPLLSK